MEFGVYYRSTRPVAPAEADAIRQAASAANWERTWLVWDPVQFSSGDDDGHLFGRSMPNLPPHPDDAAAAARSGLPYGGVWDMLGVLCRLSRDHGIDWGLNHGPHVGYIRAGVCDGTVRDQIEAYTRGNAQVHPTQRIAREDLVMGMNERRKVKACSPTTTFSKSSRGACGTMPDPDWWNAAVELEAHDKLAEAEAVIRNALSPRGDPWDAQTAHLYALRCRRLLKEGRREEAKAAAEKGYDFMLSYASGATSGGEGIALSQEAEDYRRELTALLRQRGSRKRGR